MRAATSPTKGNRTRRAARRLPALAASAALLGLLLFAPARGETIPADDAASGRRACDGIVASTGEALRRHHNPGLVAIDDLELCFEGYVSLFDGDDDDDGDGEPDILALPHAVIQRIDRAVAAPESRARPSAWFTVPSLARLGIAPSDASYRFSRAWRAEHPDWYERGHLAQKYLLERLGADAAWYSHNVANAVPQRGLFNRTAWLDLECRSGAWANLYGTIWVISGPVFVTGRPQSWLREPGRQALAVAIPDYLFKVVVREFQGELLALAFLLRQSDPAYEDGTYVLADGLTSIARIEALTGLELVTAMARGAELRTRPATALWPVRASAFDPGCRRFAADDP